jgi:hypothetical protein
MPLNETVVDAVANENFKVGAGASAHYAGSAMNSHASQAQDLAAHRTRLQIIAESALQNGLAFGRAVVAKAIEGIQQASPADAIADVAAGSVATKGAGNVPPVTP